jgi:hypothetical protein
VNRFASYEWWFSSSEYHPSPFTIVNQVMDLIKFTGNFVSSPGRGFNSTLNLNLNIELA